MKQTVRSVPKVLSRNFHEFLGKNKGVITAQRPKIPHFRGCRCAFCTSIPKENGGLVFPQGIGGGNRLDPTMVQSAALREDPDIAQLLENNVSWVKKAHANDPSFFSRIGGPQKPTYMYIGCSDSRVPANQILGLGPGEVFVHRNVGNQVVGNDLNVLSGIEFAVDVLDIKHIIVTGHYGCGACYAATQSGRDLGLLENWLRSLRDIYRNHHTTLDSIQDPEERHRKFVEVSVVEQCLNLYKTGIVQKKRKETHQRAKDGEVEGGRGAYPRIHAMVFDPAVGLLKKLPIDFKTSVQQFRHIYDLY